MLGIVRRWPGSSASYSFSHCMRPRRPSPLRRRMVPARVVVSGPRIHGLVTFSLDRAYWVEAYFLMLDVIAQQKSPDREAGAKLIFAIARDGNVERTSPRDVILRSGVGRVEGEQVVVTALAPAGPRARPVTTLGKLSCSRSACRRRRGDPRRTPSTSSSAASSQRLRARRGRTGMKLAPSFQLLLRAASSVTSRPSGQSRFSASAYSLNVETAALFRSA